VDCGAIDAELPPTVERARIALFAVGAACVDGTVHPDQSRVLGAGGDV